MVFSDLPTYRRSQEEYGLACEKQACSLSVGGHNTGVSSGVRQNGDRDVGCLHTLLCSSIDSALVACPLKEVRARHSLSFHQ